MSQAILLPNEIMYSIDNRVKNIKRGDIFLADLSLALGSEQTGIKYVLVIGNDIGNKYSHCVEVCCITSQKKSALPTHVKMPLGNGLPKESTILTEHKKTIDKVRLISHKTRLSPELMNQVDRALMISLGINI